MDVAVQNETSGKLTTTMLMGADFYAMAKAGAAQAAGAEGASAGDGFCVEPGDVLTENADGSATCTTIKEGTFAELTAGEDGQAIDQHADGGQFDMRHVAIGDACRHHHMDEGFLDGRLVCHHVLSGAEGPAAAGS